MGQTNEIKIYLKNLDIYGYRFFQDFADAEYMLLVVLGLLFIFTLASTTTYFLRPLLTPPNPDLNIPFDKISPATIRMLSTNGGVFRNCLGLILLTLKARKIIDVNYYEKDKHYRIRTFNAENPVSEEEKIVYDCLKQLPEKELILKDKTPKDLENIFKPFSEYISSFQKKYFLKNYNLTIFVITTFLTCFIIGYSSISHNLLVGILSFFLLSFIYTAIVASYTFIKSVLWKDKYVMFTRLFHITISLIIILLLWSQITKLSGLYNLMPILILECLCFFIIFKNKYTPDGLRLSRRIERVKYIVSNLSSSKGRMKDLPEDVMALSTYRQDVLDLYACVFYIKIIDFSGMQTQLDKENPGVREIKKFLKIFKKNRYYAEEVTDQKAT